MFMCSVLVVKESNDEMFAQQSGALPEGTHKLQQFRSRS